MANLSNAGNRLPQYLRLPPQEQLCPWSSLSRGKINELILPSKTFPVPRVQSIVLPNRGENKKGVRLILARSLFAYLKRLEKDQIKAV